MTASGRATGALILAALLWGSAGTFIKYGLGSWAPMTLLTVQLAGATAVLWSVLLVRGYRRPAGLRRVVLLGALEPALCYGLITFGLTRTSAANSAVLSGLESFFVVVLAAVFLRERMRRRSVLGLAVAVAGVLVLEGAQPATSFGVGDLLVLAGILCASVYVLVARSSPYDDDALTVTAHQFAAGLFLLLPVTVTELALGVEPLPTTQSAGAWGAALASGVFGYAVSFLLYNHALPAVSAGRSGIILNLLPVFGVITAVLFLGETLSAWQILGAALVVMSIFVFPGDDPDSGEQVDIRAAVDPRSAGEPAA